jgi:hypothetical protein
LGSANLSGNATVFNAKPAGHLISAHPQMAIANDGLLLVVPSQKCRFLPKVWEIKRLCGGVVYCAAEASAQIDAKIGQKGRLWMEIS